MSPAIAAAGDIFSCMYYYTISPSQLFRGAGPLARGRPQVGLLEHSKSRTKLLCGAANHGRSRHLGAAQSPIRRPRLQGRRRVLGATFHSPNKSAWLPVRTRIRASFVTLPAQILRKG